MKCFAVNLSAVPEEERSQVYEKISSASFMVNFLRSGSGTARFLIVYSETPKSIVCACPGIPYRDITGLDMSEVSPELLSRLLG